MIRLFDRHGRWESRLDEYVDGRLDPRVRGEFEAHMAGCAACTEAVAGVTATRTLLAALPEREPPRSFRLTPEMASEPAGPAMPAPKPSPRPAWAMRSAQALAGLAAVGLVTVVSIDLSQDDGGGDASMSTLSAEEAQPLTAETTAGDAGSAPAQSESALPSHSESDGSAEDDGTGPEDFSNEPAAEAPPASGDDDAGGDANERQSQVGEGTADAAGGDAELQAISAEAPGTSDDGNTSLVAVEAAMGGLLVAALAAIGFLAWQRRRA
jgi:hypothetical protein